MDSSGTHVGQPELPLSRHRMLVSAALKVSRIQMSAVVVDVQ